MQDAAILAKEILLISGYHELKMIRVETKSDARPPQIVLRGTVSSFFMKQLAQEKLFDLSKSTGHVVCNLVEVVSRNFG